MLNLCRNVAISRKIVTNLVALRTASNRSINDQFHQPDATPEEIRLVQERLKLRKALREEYKRKATDPHDMDPYIFDPMIQRWYSMHMTITDRFIPTFKNWCVFMCSIILPIVLYAQLLRYDKQNFERQCRSGELEYKDRLYRLA